MRLPFVVRGFLFGGLVLSCACPLRADDEAGGIPIATLERTSEIDFHKEVLPILRRSCLACHNATDAESDLVLESAETMLKGGTEGAAIVPGNGAESLIVQLAAMQREPFMPPEDNAADAPRLTSEELGLIKLWIDQGAKMGTGSSTNTIAWRALPELVAPILAVALDRTGDWAICGRGNRLFVCHVPSGRMVQELVDSSVTTGPAAHWDLVQSLAMGPHGDLIASGGYQTVKLWRRQPYAVVAEMQAGPQVTSADVPVEGGQVAVGTSEGEIRLYDLKTGSSTITLTGHEGAVHDVRYSRDGHYLVSGGADGTVRIWKLADGSATRVVTPDEVFAVAWVAPDRVAAAGVDPVLRVWNVVSPAEGEHAPVVELTGHGSAVTSLAVPAGVADQVVSGSDDGTVRVWGIGDGKELRKFEHGAPVARVAVTPDGARVASSGRESGVKLWNSANGEMIAEIQRDARLEERVFAEQQSLALARQEENAVQARVAELEKQIQAQEEAVTKSRETLTGAETALAEKQRASDEAQANKLSADTALKLAEAAVADADRLLTAAREQQKTSGEALAALASDITKAKQALGDAPPAPLEAVATNISAADQMLQELQKHQEQSLAALTAKLDELKNAAQPALEQAKKSVEETAKKADEAAKELQAATKAKDEAAINLSQSERDVSRSKEALAEKQSEKDTWSKRAADHDESRKTFEESLAQSAIHNARIDFSQNGLELLVGVDDRVAVHDVASGGLLSVYEHASEGGLADVVAAGDAGESRALSVSVDGRVVVWKSNPQWVLEQTLGGVDQSGPLVDRVLCLDFSADGRWLAAGSGQPSRSGAVALFELPSGNVVHALPEAHSDTVYSIQFSPDGKWLATSSADRMARIFDVETGQVSRTLEGHTHHVLDIAWRANGKMLATAGADQVIKVWDLESGEQKRTITGMNKEVTSVVFAGIGGQTISSCGDANVRLQETGDGKTLRTMNCGDDFLYDVSVSANGKRVVAGGSRGVLKVFDAENGKLLREILPTP